MSDHTDDDSIELEGPARTAREALLKYLVGFVCTDIDGVEHDLAHLYATSTREGQLHRVHADSPPDELVEDAEGSREWRGGPVDFLVNEAEHDRMMRGGVLEVVDHQSVSDALSERLLNAVRGQLMGTSNEQ